MDHIQKPSSETYEGKKENCTVMCFEFIKDWGKNQILPRTVNVGNWFELARTSLKDIFVHICGYNPCCGVNQQVHNGNYRMLILKTKILCLRKRLLKRNVLRMRSLLRKPLLRDMLIVRFWSVCFELIFL